MGAALLHWGPALSVSSCRQRGRGQITVSGSGVTIIRREMVVVWVGWGNTAVAADYEAAPVMTVIQRASHSQQRQDKEAEQEEQHVDPFSL